MCQNWGDVAARRVLAVGVAIIACSILVAVLSDGAAYGQLVGRSHGSQPGSSLLINWPGVRIPLRAPLSSLRTSGTHARR
jgi:hypothetical protein